MEIFENAGQKWSDLKKKTFPKETPKTESFENATKTTTTATDLMPNNKAKEISEQRKSKQTKSSNGNTSVFVLDFLGEN